MVRYQYQGTPATPPALTIAKSSGSITSAKAGSWSFWLQYRNRAGYSVVGTRTDTTVAAGDRLEITIPSSARPSDATSGSCIQEFVVLAANGSTNPSAAAVIATYPGYQDDEITTRSLPYTLYLSTDSHLSLSETVTLEASLPTGSDRVHGMRRYVDETNTIVYWDSYATEWKSAVPQVFNTYVSSAIGTNGANIDVSAIDTTTVIYPDYSLDGSTSIPVGFWLVNDSATTAIAKGTPIGLTITNGTEDVSFTSGIVGGVILTFKGYVNLTTGVKDTTGEGGVGTMSGINLPIPYQGKQTGLTLPKDLPAGYAYWMDVSVELTPEMLNNRMTEGSTLRISPYFYANFAIWNPVGNILGTYIAPDFDRRRLLPTSGLSAIAGTGSGNIVLSGVAGSFSFYNVGQQTLVGFTANTPDQNVWIGIDGLCLIGSSQPTGTVLRSVVGTVNGAGRPTSFSGTTVTLNGSTLLRVTVTFPTAIRSDYPDVIAGDAATLNATYLRIYVRPSGGGDILQFEELITAGATSQVFTVGSTAGTDIGATLPDRASDSFGLFEPGNASYSLSTTSGSSSFDADTYVVSIGFYYTGTVTSISHSTDDGCIFEAERSLVDSINQTIEVGTVRSGWEGEAAAEIVYSSGTPTLNLVLPKGDRGMMGPQGLPGEDGNPADYSALAKANLFYG